MVVSPRGHDFICYCPGEHGLTGCYAEFGDTEEEAYAEVENTHILKDL